jgi:outer membrane protein TolC
MKPMLLIALLASSLPMVAAAEPRELTVGDAIREALAHNPGLMAGAADVDARAAEARGADAARLPTASLTGQAIGTNDPLAVLGLRLQERSVTATDFTPHNLNFPGVVGAIGLGLEANQPIYAGGRITAARSAAKANAAASRAEQAFRRQQLALEVVSTYFRAAHAELAVQDAQATLQDARETEDFIKARFVEQQLLQSDVSRAASFRARAEADVIAARQRLNDARDELVLLAGDAARDARLTTPLEALGGGENSEQSRLRADLEAARQREEAARAQIDVVRAANRPQVGLQLRAGTLWGGSDIGAFATLGLGARWDLFAPVRSAEIDAAAHAADAASATRRWREAQAGTETGKARRAIESAHARVSAAREALAAAETAHERQRARHREGLLPLTDLLDAEIAVASARMTLHEAQLNERVGHAQLQLALGQPIEGVAQ